MSRYDGLSDTGISWEELDHLSEPEPMRNISLAELDRLVGQDSRCPKHYHKVAGLCTCSWGEAPAQTEEKPSETQD